MLARYAVLGVIGVVLLGGIMLLARPLIFSLGSPRDDSGYPVIAAQVADAGSRVIELLLTDPHDLPGEQRIDDHASFTVVISPLPGGGYAVVAAWSPTNDCRLTLGADRLVDCDADAWTYEGLPLNSADPPLQRFPLTVTDGVIVVDFTRPYDAVGS